ncbi:hypothetical protein ACOME3_006504 [Neoechinorhynchus agilis]
MQKNSSMTLKHLVLIISFIIMIVTAGPISQFRFCQDKHEATIFENSKPGDYILTLSVCGSLTSAFSKNVRYELLSTASTLNGSSSLFALNATTGILTVSENAVFDYESRSSYELSVSARLTQRKGAYVRTRYPTIAFTDLIIRVLDINDCTPVIKLLQWNNGRDDPIEMDSNLTILENQQIEDLAVVNVFDGDKGINSEIDLYANDTRFRTELIHLSGHRSTFSLKLTTPIDREIESEISLTLIAVDRGVPPLNQTQLIKISILDENDSAPQFKMAEKVIQLKENNKRGIHLTTVISEDLDLSTMPNQTRYTILHGDEELPFMIDAVTGEITVTEVLDYEQTSSYKFDIRATDSGNDMFSTMTIVVEIIDENDNPPVFATLDPSMGAKISPSRNVTFFVSEDALIQNAIIGNLIVEDDDQGLNAESLLRVSVQDCVDIISIDSRRNFVYFTATEGNETEYCKNLMASKRFMVLADNVQEPYWSANVTVQVIASPFDNQPLPMLLNVTNKSSLRIDITKWSDSWCKQPITSNLIGYLFDSNCDNCQFDQQFDGLKSFFTSSPFVITRDGRFQMNVNKREMSDSEKHCSSRSQKLEIQRRTKSGAQNNLVIYLDGNEQDKVLVKIASFIALIVLMIVIIVITIVCMAICNGFRQMRKRRRKSRSIKDLRISRPIFKDPSNIFTQYYLPISQSNTSSHRLSTGSEIVV